MWRQNIDYYLHNNKNYKEAWLFGWEKKEKSRNRYRNIRSKDIFFLKKERY